MKRIRWFLSLLLAVLLLFSLAGAAAAEDGDLTYPFDNSAYFGYEDYVIHYRTFAAENAKGQIFLIHGFALSSYCFEALALRLCDAGYTCVIADLPDFGYSVRETECTPKLPREEIMHALMVHLSDEPWILGGHSMGGYIALALATTYPDSVEHLMLYGTSGNSGSSALRTRLMTNQTFINIMGPLMERMGRATPLVRLLLFAASLDCSFTKNYPLSYITDPFLIADTGKGALYSFSMLPKTDFDAVQTLPPILYVNAKNDLVIPKSDIQKLRGYLPDGSTDVTLEDGGHVFIESRADETAAITLTFLAQRHGQ